MANVLKQLNDWADKNPDKLLFSFLDIQGNALEKYTYEEFLHRIMVISSHLHKNYRFKKNDRLLLAYPPGIEMICAFFACTRLGLIPVPIYPPSSAGFQAACYKMIYIAQDCQAAAVLTNKDYYWSFKLNLTRNNITKKNLVAKLLWINTTDFREIATPEVPADAAEILFLQYTSGSTSEPKGVKVTHENIIYNADVVADHLPIAVSWLPQYHDMGLIGYYLFSAIKGGTTYGFSTLDFIRRPALWLETISKYRGTASSAPNFAYEYCLAPGKIPEETLAKLDLSSMRFLMTAAEPISPTTYQRFLDFFKPYGLDPKSFFAAYGLAENTLAVSNYGRKFISVDKHGLTLNQLKILPQHAENSAKQIMSCGKPLGDHVVKIVDPNQHLDLGTGAIGEIWVKGSSKCIGFWNKPDLTKELFEASLKGENTNNHNSYLRTGDLGFIHDGELYICGRAKDMIIIRGLNYYPQDIEKVVEESTEQVRKGYVAAFGIEDDGEEKLVVVAGVKNNKSIPDPIKILEAIRKNLNIQVHTIAFVPTRDIPKTSSGKIMRQKAKQDWLERKVEVLQEFASPKEIEQYVLENKESSPFDELKRKYGLTGEETYSLGKALDSLDLVNLVVDLEKLLERHNALKLAKETDTSLIQEISISEFFGLIDQFENSSVVALNQLKKIIIRLQKEHKLFEQNMMLQDSKLSFRPNQFSSGATPQPASNILLTGGTGFFGPFIMKSLLQQTSDPIYVIVRAENEKSGKDRLRAAMELTGYLSGEILRGFEERVIPVCGDLGKSQLGLDNSAWNFFADTVRTIYNNGAIVNYLFNYEKMREVNVAGTNEILKLAFQGRSKVFNHISTTFIFGWAVKDTLFETDTNDSLDLLDFGYSQTKWVSEQIVTAAMNYGLKTRIFRPALLTPSVHGGGSNFDISIRLLAFMINHGLGVNARNQVSFTPADVAANNIVAIAEQAHTVNRTFHVTRDHYASMMDITDIITKLTGREFKLYDLPKFVPQVISRCTKDDLLFPLLDFLVRSVDNISAMEFKRYDSSNFQNSRNASKWGLPDPSLEDTVRGMLLFMEKRGIIDVSVNNHASGSRDF
jgi:thioester reductase-like protein